MATREDLRDFIAEAKESEEDEGFSRRSFWPTKEAALRDLLR